MKSPTLAEDRSGTVLIRRKPARNRERSWQTRSRVCTRAQMPLELVRSSVVMIAGQLRSFSFRPSSVSLSSTSTPHFGAYGIPSQTLI